MTDPGRAELARRPAFLVAAVSFALVGGLALWLVPWSWVPGGTLIPARASQLFTGEQIARAEHYSWLKRGLGWPSYFLSLALLLALALTSRGSRLVRRVVDGRRWWLAVPLGVVAVLLAQRLVTLPFGIASHVVDRHYGISRQGWVAWSVDLLTSLAVATVVTTLLVLVVVAAARRSPRWWFAWAGGTALVLSLAGSFLYPVVVEPLFNHFTPMAAGPFKQSILRLADREGVHVDDVLVADASRRTTTVNAYVSGLGSTRRVVVYDNLLRDLTPAEARVVIAHELGHAKHHDVLLGTTLAAVGSVGAIALLALVLDAGPVRRRARVSGPGDPAVLALVLALAGVGSFLVSPVQNTVSRAIEARADRTSLETTHAGATFVRMQRRLALASLSDPTPPAPQPALVGEPPDGPAAGRAAPGARGGRPMSRVLVVTNDFPTRRGGIESFVLSLCQGMPADDVVVYTASMPGDRAFDADLPFPVYRDPGSMLLPTPAVARRVSAVLRRHGCDRVLFGASAPLGLLAPALRRAGARRLVALTHGHEVWWARVPGTRQLLRRVAEHVDVLTYVSEWCHERIAPALSPAARARMRRLSPGVDPLRFYPGCGGADVRRELGLSEEAPVVVCLARLVPRKGQDTLLRAWPEVLRGRPDALLLVVGDGPERGRLERLTDRLGVRGSVTFTGGVAWEEVPAYVDAGDVFAMPCRSRRLGLEVEAWGIVFLEAQACGLPVVIGDSGGAPETLVGPGEVVRATPGRVAAAVGEWLDRGRSSQELSTEQVESLTWARTSARLEQLWS